MIKVRSYKASRETHQKMKVFAAVRGITLRVLLEEMVREYQANHFPELKPEEFATGDEDASGE